MSILRRLFFRSGGPDYLLSGWPKATGGSRKNRENKPAATLKIAVAALCCFFLATVSLAKAQDAATNAPPPDPAPASISPPSSTASQSAPITSQMISPNGTAPQQDDIDDIRPPFFFLSLWIWLWIALALVAAIALLFLLWKWLSKPAYLSPKSAYDLTLEKLEKARALLREDDPVPYAIAVSEAIRSYLGQRFQSPSTRRTTEEFLRMMEADEHTPLAAHRDLLRQFLQACDLVKFARYQPTLVELEEVQQRAFTFVHATNPALVPVSAAGGRA